MTKRSILFLCLFVSGLAQANIGNKLNSSGDLNTTLKKTFPCGMKADAGKYDLTSVTEDSIKYEGRKKHVIKQADATPSRPGQK
jgi:hypothetical protein